MQPMGWPFPDGEGRLGLLGNAPDRGLLRDGLHDVLGLHELTGFAYTHVDNDLVDVDIAHRGHSSCPHFAIADVCWPTM